MMASSSNWGGHDGTGLVNVASSNSIISAKDHIITSTEATRNGVKTDDVHGDNAVQQKKEFGFWGLVCGHFTLIKTLIILMI